jgi:anion-transporting  ArsA/GET3 family ATPase
MPDLLERPFIFVTGKGGVGRTTVAAALGLAAAARGRRTVVCEVGDQQRLPRAFGVAEPHRGREVELAPRLAGSSIEPNAVLRHWLEVQLRSRALVAVLSRTPVFTHFIAAVPGAREVVTLAQAWNLAQPQRWGERGPGYDTVIVDSAASGHALGMLRTPRTFGEMARVGTVRRQADRVRSLITDPQQTAYVAVALAEEMPVTETLDLAARLRAEVGFGPEVAVVNAVVPQRFSAAQLERLAAGRAAAGRTAARAAVDVALDQGERARAQAAHVRRLRRGLDAPVITLPQLLDGEVGRTQLLELARELERKLGARGRWPSSSPVPDPAVAPPDPILD